MRTNRYSFPLGQSLAKQLQAILEPTDIVQRNKLPRNKSLTTDIVIFWARIPYFFKFSLIQGLYTEEWG